MRLLDRYEEIVGHQEVERLRRLAERLAGKRIVHINSTRSGGGVAEILGWMVPLMQELGIDARWEVVTAPPDFYRVTKAFHNGLQGLPVSLRKSDFDLHYEINRQNAERLKLEADIVFVHDPQPICLPLFTPPGQVGRWIWRCHIDASRPNRAIWKYLEKAVAHYDAAIFSMAAFARPLACPMFLIPPSIDPLSDKNCAIPEAERLETLAGLGIDPDRPLLLQVSRFDRFKDPLGVIEAYRLLKPYYPAVQLALAGGSADDDPEGEEVLRDVLEQAGNDADLKVLMLPPDSHRTINALPALGDRGAAKVAEGGFRPDRHRGAVEGQAGHRRRLRRNYLAGARLSHGVPGLFSGRGGLPRSLPVALRRQAATHGPGWPRVRPRAFPAHPEFAGLFFHAALSGPPRVADAGGLIAARRQGSVRLRRVKSESTREGCCALVATPYFCYRPAYFAENLRAE